MSAHQQCSEHAEVPRELPEHADAHLRAIGRPRIEPLQMLEVHPRSSRHIWLEMAIREVPAYECTSVEDGWRESSRPEIG